MFSVHCNMARHADIKDFLPACKASKYENLQAHGNFTKLTKSYFLNVNS